MKHALKVAFTLITVCLTAGFAQPAKGQAAYVYVAGSTKITGYSAAADGRLTPIPGLPIPASVSHLSTTSKTVFGPGTDNVHIYSFNIGADGTLVPGPVTDAEQYNDNQCPGTLGPTQIDYSGSYLYSLVTPYVNSADGCDDSGIATHVYPIKSGGALGEGLGWYTQINYSGAPNSLRILGNNKFAYLTGCAHYGSNFTPTTEIWELGTGSFAGWLLYQGTYDQAPEPSDSEDFFCPSMLTGDPTNHLAYALRKYYPSKSELSTPYYLASYTADSQGNLSTESNYTNMPTASIGTLSSMSINPAGDLLAVAGSYGFELFHFNGDSPITKIGSLHASDPVAELGWDKAGHLYVLTGSKLYVYAATASGVEAASGSPYTLSGSGPFSMIALSLTD